jgi:hypothetical protein
MLNFYPLRFLTRRTTDHSLAWYLIRRGETKEQNNRCVEARGDQVVLVASGLVATCMLARSKFNGFNTTVKYRELEISACSYHEPSLYSNTFSSILVMGKLWIPTWRGMVVRR